MKRSVDSTSFNFAASLLLISLITPIGWLYVIQPLILYIQANPVYATAIPWLQSEADCVATGRSWDGEDCWDVEHDPNF